VEDELFNQVLDRLKVVGGRKAGGNYVAWCPFHPDGKGEPPHHPTSVSGRGLLLPRLRGGPLIVGAGLQTPMSLLHFDVAADGTAPKSSWMGPSIRTATSWKSFS